MKYRIAGEGRRDPADASLHSNLLLTLISSELDPVEVTDEHLTFGRKFAVPVMPRTAKRRPGGCGLDLFPAISLAMRFAFHPADLRHPDGAHLRHSLTPARTASMRQRALMATAGQWRNIAALADDTAAEMIGGDDLDLLIDLSGHTGA